MPQGVAWEAGAAETAWRVAAQLAAGAVLQGALVHICRDRCSQEHTASLPLPRDYRQAGSLDPRTGVPTPKCTSCCWDMTGLRLCRARHGTQAGVGLEAGVPTGALALGRPHSWQLKPHVPEACTP